MEGERKGERNERGRESGQTELAQKDRKRKKAEGREWKDSGGGEGESHKKGNALFA